MLKQSIAQAIDKKGIALMTHIICGTPSFEDNWTMLECMEQAGVDIVEFQFPFSEPIADGPVFSAANQTSLLKGTQTKDCFNFLKRASKHFSFHTLMMGYYNTLYKFDEALFCESLKDAGAKGAIIADLPFQASSELRALFQSHNLSFVPLIAPTTTEMRLVSISEEVNSLDTFAYVVARKGVTGKHTTQSESLQTYLSRIKKYFTLPLGIGFGIKTREDVQALKGHAELAIVGTALLQAYQEGGSKQLQTLLDSLR